MSSVITNQSAPVHPEPRHSSQFVGRDRCSRHPWKKKNQVKALCERNCTVLLQLISVNQIRVTSLTEMYTGLWSSWELARWSSSPSCCNVVKLVEKLVVLISFLLVDAATTSTCVCVDMDHKKSNIKSGMEGPVCRSLIRLSIPSVLSTLRERLPQEGRYQRRFAILTPTCRNTSPRYAR